MRPKLGQVGSRLAAGWQVGRLYPRLLVGIAIILGVALIAAFAPLLAPENPELAHPGAILQAPSAAHLLGTDSSGMDVLSRLIYAPRIDLTLAVSATVLAIAIGLPLGLVAGYYDNWLTSVVLRISDIVQSFPVFVLGMALVVLSGQKIINVVGVVALVQAPIYIRLLRSQSLYVRGRTFIEATRASGLSDRQIMLRHVLPNSMGPVFAMASVTVGTAMLLTAGLSFVGAGVRVPTPEWGSMISIGAPSLIDNGAWWPSVPPGIMLALTVMGFGMVGDALSEVTDPRRRRSARRPPSASEPAPAAGMVTVAPGPD
ncbi:MAG: ABC transporter permease [Solirubrobacterales bacterium]